MSEISNEMCESHRDQHAIIKFYRLWKKSATKTYEKMKAVYGDVFFSSNRVRLAQNFFSGRELMEL